MYVNFVEILNLFKTLKYSKKLSIQILQVQIAIRNSSKDLQLLFKFYTKAILE